MANYEVNIELSKILLDINNHILINKKYINRNILFVDISTNIFNNIFYNDGLYNYKNKKTIEFIEKSILYYLNYPTDIDNYLYIFLTDLKSNINKHKNKMLIKIGFTQDIAKRHTDLEKDFKCKVYLLYWTRINNLKQEQELHSVLKREFTNLYYELKYNNKIISKETYIFHSNIMNRACMYQFPLHRSVAIEIEKTKQVEVENVEKTKQVEVENVEKTKQVENVEKTKQLEIDLKIKELNINLKIKELEHELKIKQEEKEIEDKKIIQLKLKIELCDKLQLLEYKNQLEILKIKN